MPPLDSAAQQENWDVVDYGEKHDDRMGGGGIMIILNRSSPSPSSHLPATNVREK